MKKICVYILIIISICFSTPCVYAYTYNLVASAETVHVGDPKPCVTLYTDDVMGFWQINSSDPNVLRGAGSDSIDSGNPYSSTVCFDIVNTGSAVISVSPMSAGLNVYSTLETLGTRTVTINVIDRPTYTEPIEINRTYSANNYLSNLVVEGFELVEFDKEKLEYNLEVDNTVTKVNIEATVEDDTATVYGAGEIDVVEGKNEIKIIVTAENGNERTYVVNIIVKELNPINVKINKENFTLVKKEDSLPELDNYVESTIKIDGNDIPALKGKITKYTLVGLKDKKGDIALYIYDAKNKTYTPYNEIKFNNLSLYYMENNNTNYKKTTIKIKGKEIIAYKKSGLDYYLIYGMNLDTGKVNWYTYDKEEGTIQKYVGSNKVNVMDNNSYKYLVYILAGISSILVLFMMILFIKNKKKMD